jgi:TusA-related sulfurtransferase
MIYALVGTKFALGLAGLKRRSIAALKPKADHVLDFRQTITPFALLKLTQVLREMKQNEVLEIITREDGDARADVFKVIPFASCEVIDMEFNKKANFCLIRVKRI